MGEVLKTLTRATADVEVEVNSETVSVCVVVLNPTVQELVKVIEVVLAAAA